MASFRAVLFVNLVAARVSTSNAQDLECSEQEDPLSLLQQQQFLQRRALRVENSSKAHRSVPSMLSHRSAESESRLAEDPDQNYTSSFLDDAGLICYDGNGRDVEGLLGLLKAGVAGTQFVNTHAQAHTSCEGRGYTVNATQSACYPNVMTYSMTSSGFAEQEALISQAITHYSLEYNLSRLTAQSMFDCVCHPQSPSMMMRSAGTCAAALGGIWGSFRHNDGQTNFLCDEGPFQYAAFMLAMMKTTVLLPMHLNDQIAPLSCADVGFPYIYDFYRDIYDTESTFVGMGLPIPADHCFPSARMGVATQIGEYDPGIQHCLDAEHNLTKEGLFREIAIANDWDYNILENGGFCICEHGSEEWNNHTAKEQTLCATPSMNTPIREWWFGQQVG